MKKERKRKEEEEKEREREQGLHMKIKRVIIRITWDTKVKHKESKRKCWKERIYEREMCSLSLTLNLCICEMQVYAVFNHLCKIQ